MPTTPPVRSAFALVSPPALFVGRRDETAALRRALDRGPVSLVTGAAGAGKSTLVSVALREEPREAPVVVVRLQLGRSFERFLLDAVRALVHALGIGPVPWGDSLRDLTALHATLVELADALGATVVAEDLHHAPPERVAAFADVLARGARGSRWVLTSRRDELVPELLEQTVRLSPLSEELLTRLALDLGAPAADAGRLAMAADGSPWALRQAVAASLRRGGERDAAQQRLEQVLRRLDIALDVDQLSRLVDALGTAPALVALEQAGSAERLVSGHVRLHDAAREAPAQGDDDRVTAAVVRQLSDAEAPEVALQALRNHLQSGDIDEAETWLRSRGPALIAQGFAPHLWDALCPHEAAPLLAWKLEAALALGGGPALDWAVRQPEPTDAGVRLCWIQAQLQAGHVDRAVAGARALPAGPRAAILQGRAALAAGEPEEALARAELALQMLADATGEAERRLELESLVLGARACVFTGRFERGWSLAERARLALLREPIETSVGLADRLTSAYMNLGRPDRVRELVARYSARVGTEVALLLGSRHFLPNLATVAIEGARLHEGRRLLSLLQRGEPSGDQWFVLHMNSMRLGMVSGDFVAAREHLATLRSQAVERGQSLAYQWAMVGQALMDALDGREQPSTPWHPAIPRPQGGLVRAYLAGFETSFALRSGGDVDAVAWEPPPNLRTIPDAQAVTLMARAERELLAGSPRRALETARAAGQVAAESDWGALGLECRALIGDILAVAGEWDAVARESAQLQVLAANAGSGRFAVVAGFLAMLGSRTVDGPLCERYATAADVAPRVARRVRACLGGPARLDPIDVRVLEAFSAAASTRIRPVRAGAATEAWSPGWGIDGPESRVHLPGLRQVELGQVPMGLLAALADRGGRASKEELVAAVWDPPEYHPLRDDKRLQMAVSRLRAAIEDDPKQPTRLVTTGDGYALGTDERVWWVEMVE